MERIFPVVIPVVLLLSLGLMFWLVRRKATRGGGCCGDLETADKKRVVKDRNRAHYPYRVVLNIGGMTCENCARKVENALNSREGIWARVDVGNHRAEVLLKQAPDQRQLAKAVMEAGYVVTEMQEA